MQQPAPSTSQSAVPISTRVGMWNRILESLRDLCQARPAEGIEHIFHLLDERDLPPPAFYHAAFHLLLAESYYRLDRVILSMGMLELARGIRASVRPIDIEDSATEAWQSLQAPIDELHAEVLPRYEALRRLGESAAGAERGTGDVQALHVSEESVAALSTVDAPRDTPPSTAVANNQPASRLRERLGATDSGIVLEPLISSEDPHQLTENEGLRLWTNREGNVLYHEYTPDV